MLCKFLGGKAGEPHAATHQRFVAGIVELVLTIQPPGVHIEDEKDESAYDGICEWAP